MADEIQMNASVIARKGQLSYTFQPFSQSVTMTGNAMAGAVQNISTTTESLSVVDITTPGIGTFINVTVGSEMQVGTMSGTNFVPLLQLEYGEPAIGRMATTSLVAKVTVPTNGTANLQWNLLSD